VGRLSPKGMVKRQQCDQIPVRGWGSGHWKGQNGVGEGSRGQWDLLAWTVGHRRKKIRGEVMVLLKGMAHDTRWKERRGPDAVGKKRGEGGGNTATG
jgi:hypothetical protein